MFNQVQKWTIAAALLIAVAMGFYPPFTDRAVHLPEPMYAPFNNPPLGANGGQSITILWEVLIVQWTIVFTVALGLCMTFRERKPLSRTQTICLWVGIGCLVAILLFPPYNIGSGGPFGFPTLHFKVLFLPESYATMAQPLLAAEVIAVVLVTFGAIALVGRPETTYRERI